MRTHSGHVSTSGFSMDSMAPSEQSFVENGFGGGMHDMLSLDMSSRATPDSESTAASSSRLAFMPHSVATQNAHNPVNKLDALMFPSDDPFAYPNQPMMELGFQSSKDGTSVTMAQDPNFFFPGTLEEMGNSFVSQPPPYMTPQNGRQSIGGMNMYDTNGMMTMQHPGAAQALAQAQARQAQARAQAQAQAQVQARQQQAAQRAQQQQQQQQQSQQQQQQGQQQQQTQQQQQQRSRGFGFFHRRTRQPQEQQQAQQIDQMFTEHGMQPDFGSFFGSGRGGFQGM